MNPGELKHPIQIFSIYSVKNQSLGAQPTMICAYPLISTRAKKEPIRSNNQRAIEAGATVMNEDAIFTMRDYRPAFVPAINMLIECEGSTYTIVSFYNPERYPNYIRMVAVRKKTTATV